MSWATSLEDMLFVSKRNQQSAKILMLKTQKNMTTPLLMMVIQCCLPSDLWRGTVTDSEQLVTSPRDTLSTTLSNHMVVNLVKGATKDVLLYITDSAQQMVHTFAQGR